MRANAKRHHRVTDFDKTVKPPCQEWHQRINNLIIAAIFALFFYFDLYILSYNFVSLPSGWQVAIHLTLLGYEKNSFSHFINHVYDDGSKDS